MPIASCTFLGILLAPHSRMVPSLVEPQWKRKQRHSFQGPFEDKAATCLLCWASFCFGWTPNRSTAEEQSWPAQFSGAPYEVKLDIGHHVFALADSEVLIRREAGRLVGNIGKDRSRNYFIANVFFVVVVGCSEMLAFQFKGCRLLPFCGAPC